MVYLSPKNIIVEFLREKLTDPRARAETTNTEEFNGGGTEFTLTAPSGSISCITAVTVTSVAKTKWKDYYIDWQNQKIIFYSSTTSGTNNVDITYKYGTTNWIYPDKAKKTLSKTAFPRINVLIPSGTGERLGQYNSDVENSIRFQIDLWSKENQDFTISGVKYEGDKLAEYLGWQIMAKFRSNEGDLYPALYNYTPLGVPRDLGFNQELECFHKIVEVEMKGINIGEGYND
jgi:hypothetical protein